MRHRRALILAVGTAFSLLGACDQGPTAPTERIDPVGHGSTSVETGTLTGYIPVDSIQPAVGVTIDIFPSGASAPAVSAQTDQHGVFTANVEVGAYDVAMIVPAGLYRAAGTPARISVQATANATVSVDGFALSSTAPPVITGIDGVLIRGGVAVEGLGPVPGTVVQIRKDGRELQRTTDADGLFDFGVIEAGQWELATTPPPGYILADGEQSPRPLGDIIKGDSLFVQIALATADGTGRVRVQVGADSVSALPGVIVRALADGAVVAEVTTDSSVPVNTATLVLQPGTYTIEVVPPAGYELLPGDSPRIDNVVVRTGRLVPITFWFRSTG